ncbi:MAG: hypothetical protein R2798_10800 [Chitinophagales bacterium]|nr:hypothetical protein [Bacteroidota bacterium]MCB9043351.1 hypothetical protein [Chitinophagales bacterium]
MPYKLYEILEKFTHYDWQQAESFLKNSFYNTDESLVVYFELVKKIVLDKKHFEKEAIYREVFGKNVSFNEVKLRAKRSSLLQVIQQYIIAKKLKEDTYTQQVLYLSFLRENDFMQDYKRIFDTLNEELDKQNLRDATHYNKKFELLDDYNFFSEKTFVRQDNKFDEAIYYLDVFYIVKKLRYACNVVNHHKVIAGKVEMGFIKDILVEIEDAKYLKIPIVQIYFTIYKMFTSNSTENSEHFYTAKKLMEDYGKQINFDELRDIYFFLINFCTRKINAGEQAFMREIYNLFLYTLKTKIIFQDAYLSPWNYKNICTVALQLQEYAWVKQFIKTYQKYLKEDFAENAYNYNLARYYFSLRKYEKTLQLLQEVEYTDLYYSLDSKSMLLKTYYLLNETNALFSLIDSFRRYIHRNKLISDLQRTNYLNMIRFINRLSIIHPRDSKKRAVLKQQIEECKQVADKKWLLSQFD